MPHSCLVSVKRCPADDCFCSNCVITRINTGDNRIKAQKRDPVKYRTQIRQGCKRYHKSHRKEEREYQKSWRKKNLKKARLKDSRTNTRRIRKLKTVIFNHYGQVCACCGITEFDFLTVDHINGGGRKERKGQSTYQYLRSIIKRSFPSDYQILCWNCNCARDVYGICPHKMTEEQIKQLNEKGYLFNES